MLQVQTATPAPEPKKGFGMRLFRTKTPSDSRKGSLDSNSTASTYVNDVAEPEKRRKSSIGRLLRRKSPVVTTVAVPKSPPKGPGMLKKKQDDFPAIDLSQAYQRDKQTGEQVIDHTDMLHSLVHSESEEHLPRTRRFQHASSATTMTGEELLSKQPTKVWLLIFQHLSPADRASLSFCCKAFRQHLVSSEAELELSENSSEREDFLLRLDSSLPSHLFCFACNIYHRRLNPRKESLKPTNVANPIFNCPHSQTLDKRISRVRLTSGRTLPFTFVQLAIRAHQYSPDHGIALDSLSRRWRERETQWAHQTRFAIVDGHLLMRVISTTFAAPGLPPSGVRALLYNNHEEYHPYFSTCPHWRDGELMSSVKCAISHIPKPIAGGGIVRVGNEVRARISNPQNPIVSLCGDCRPMRRCPDCPTEYLFEVKVAEDRSETDPTRAFKQALVVTRWSDLGDGSTPTDSPEWAACTGNLEGFDSFTAIGKRAISGVFESLFNIDVIPGQRILDMNPNRERLGEKGHNWY